LQEYVTMARTDPVVDVAFPVQGKKVPYDHGYLLYSALSGELPALHENAAVGIFQIPSTSTGHGEGLLASAATLKIRAPASFYPQLVGLAGCSLDLEGCRISLGVPSAHPLQPAPAAWSRLVVIKGYTEPEPFLDAAARQLEEQGIDGQPEVLRRNVVRVKEQCIVGFQLLVKGLSHPDSLTLQREGIGGKRRMGCGLFEPREEPDRDA
jgi:CRISPR-associated protein Cas6